MAYNSARETVGIFHRAADFQDAVDDLLLHGFDRSLLSIEADETQVERALGALKTSDAAADDPAVPRLPFVGMRSRSVMRGMAVSILSSIGVCAAVGAVIASGGTVALAFGVGALVAAVGITLGLAAATIEQRRLRRRLSWQQESGGILLWVSTPTPELEATAAPILTRHGADHVHAHDVPLNHAASTGGVSESFAWIDKPLRWLSMRTGPSGT